MTCATAVIAAWAIIIILANNLVVLSVQYLPTVKVLVPATLAAIFEEAVFREIVFHEVTVRARKRYLQYVLTSGLWALFHLTNLWSTASVGGRVEVQVCPQRCLQHTPLRSSQVLYAFVVGFVFHAIRESQGSVGPCIAAHVAHNAFKILFVI